MWRALLAVVALCACGDNRGVTVELTYIGAPDFVMYRDGDGEWEVPSYREAYGYRHYGLAVRDDYVAIIVCSLDTSWNDVLEVQASVADTNPNWVFGPCHQSPLRTAQVTVGIENAHGLVMFLGGQVLGAEMPGVFMGAVPLGIADLTAWSSSADSVVVRRGISIASDVTLPTVDYASESVANSSYTLTLAGTDPGPGVSYTVEGSFITDIGSGVSGWPQRTLLASTGYSQQIQIPAPSIRHATDRFVAEILEHETITVDPTRRYYRDAVVTTLGTSDASDVTVELAPQLVDFTPQQTTPDFTTAWDSLPIANWRYITTAVNGDCSAPAAQVENNQAVLVSRRWSDMHGTADVTFDGSAPGYDPGWGVLAQTPRSHSFGITTLEPSGGSVIENRTLLVMPANCTR